MNFRLSRMIVAVAAAGITVWAVTATAFEAEDYEEQEGLCFSVYGNPSVGAWSFGFEDGTRLINTPIMGQAFLHALRLRESDSWYGGLGMTIRILPRIKIAPFVGAGGGYYYSWASEDRDTVRSNSERVSPESFWGGIVEGGVRVGLLDEIHFFDFSVRHVWNGSNSRLNFWAGGIAYGQRW